MDLSRNNPFDIETFDEEKKNNEDVSKMKEWVSLKLKELENQNYHLKEENRKFNEELSKLKQYYVKKSYTPEVHRKLYKRDAHSGRERIRLKKYTSSENIDSSSSDDLIVNKNCLKNPKYVSSNNKINHEKISQPRIYGANITLLSGNSRPIYTSSRAGSLDRKLTRVKKLNFIDFKKKIFVGNEYTANNNKSRLLHDENESNIKPPTPPLHRCPSWESRIYEIADNGIKSAISTPVQQGKKFELFSLDQHLDPFSDEYTLPIFKKINGRLAKIRIDSSESMSSDLDDFSFLKSNTTSSGNESDFTNELKIYISDNNHRMTKTI